MPTPDDAIDFATIPIEKRTNSSDAWLVRQALILMRADTEYLLAAFPEASNARLLLARVNAEIARWILQS